jgi:hypothetical protein
MGAIRGEVEQKLLQLKRADAQKIYLAKLRQAGQIQINEPVLQAVSVAWGRSAQGTGRAP